LLLGDLRPIVVLNAYNKAYFMQNVSSEIQRRPRVAHPEYLNAFLENLRWYPGHFAVCVPDTADRFEFIFSIVVPEHLKALFPGLSHVLFEGQAKALSESISRCLRADKKHQRDQKKTQEFIFRLFKQCAESNNLQFLKARYPKHVEANILEHVTERWKIKRNQPNADFSVWAAARLALYEFQILEARKWCRNVKTDVAPVRKIAHERLKAMFPEIAFDRVLGHEGWVQAFCERRYTRASEVAEKFVLFEAKCEGVKLTLHRLRTAVRRGRALLEGLSHRPIVEP
jgi:hypothetical protein